MKIHSEVRGAGPLLLLSQSGEGDADRSVDLVDELVSDFTVVTYDRRGLTRSAHDGPVTLREHAADVHRLLADLTDQPVTMVGFSLGAAIGLHLAVEHPRQLGTLIAFEPVAPALLPAAERSHHLAELADIQRRYAADGLLPALREIASTLGIDPTNPGAEPDLTPQPMNDQRIANFDHFIRHDLTAIMDDDLDPAAVRTSPVRIIPAAGAGTPRHVFDYRASQELATLVGHDVVEFPGGHNGNTTHPRAYAARLRSLLG
ncbi:alpha/beta hydrolase [Longispora sp. K20-0274]|uniref:alpha/beta fold hydrolase n=1 Tax=Longispora sp. K20-0274 TaxID=3088255 RepID=UPI00399A8DDF